MKNILAVVNRPDESKFFIQYVTGLAGDLGMNVHLLNVQNPDNYIVTTEYGTAGLETAAMQRSLSSNSEYAKKRLEQQAEEIMRENNDDVLVDYSSDIGVTRMIVDQYIEDGKAGMIALEVQEEEGFWSPNSTNIEIIRQVNCPVWIVPYKAVYQPFHEVIYATDYKEQDIVTLNNLVKLLRRFSPKITALHVTNSYNFEEQAMKAGFNEIVRQKTGYSKIDVKSVVETSGENLAELISDYAVDRGADLMVILKKNRNFLEKIFTPSATKKIVRSATIPVLVYKE